MTGLPSGFDQTFINKASISPCSKRAKVVAIMSYFTILGWVVAMIIYDKSHSSFASFHLRQSIGLIITGSILTLIPLVGWLLDIGVIIAWGVGLYAAIREQEYKIPVVGEFYQKHLDFIQ